MRINVYEDTNGQRSLAGWFDPAKATRWDDGTRHDGQYNVFGLNSESQWIDETLYRTPGGRWVLEVNRERADGGGVTHAFISVEEARDWLAIAEYDDVEIAAATGADMAERGPGRPALEGDPQSVTVLIPSPLLARLDEQAADAGVSRAELMRRLLDAAVR